jgi:hypothetical protein
MSGALVATVSAIQSICRRGFHTESAGKPFWGLPQASGRSSNRH